MSFAFETLLSIFKLPPPATDVDMSFQFFPKDSRFEFRTSLRHFQTDVPAKDYEESKVRRHSR